MQRDINPFVLDPALPVLIKTINEDGSEDVRKNAAHALKNHFENWICTLARKVRPIIEAPDSRKKEIQKEIITLEAIMIYENICITYSKVEGFEEDKKTLIDSLVSRSDAVYGKSSTQNTDTADPLGKKRIEKPKTGPEIKTGKKVLKKGKVN